MSLDSDFYYVPAHIVHSRGTQEGVLCPVSLTSGHPSQRAADWPHKKQTLSFITMKVIKSAMLVTTGAMRVEGRVELKWKTQSDRLQLRLRGSLCRD